MRVVNPEEQREMENSSKVGRRILKIVAVLVGVVALVTSWQDRRAFSRLKSTGKTAVVQAPDKYSETRSRGSSTYTAEFTFKTDTGQTITRKQSFPEEVLADFKAGAPVKVVYDPRDPSEFVFEKQKGSWWGVGLGVGVIVLAVLSI
jgi:hypothetical protein